MGTASVTGAKRRRQVAGRTALVTGAGNGLGRAIAGALVASGATVVLVGRTEVKLRETAGLIAAERRSAGAASAGELQHDGGDVRVEVCDVSDEGAVRRLAASVAAAGVSILVNNAGIAGPVRPLVEVSPEEWDEVFASNVRSVFLMCRAFAPAMVEAGLGDIVNVASVSGKRPLVHRTPYVASKLAVIGLTRTLAFELGPAGVNVNSLSPGPVRGARMTRNFELEARLSGTTPQAAEAAFVARSALGRLVEEDEVAAAVLAMLAMPGLCGADVDLSAGMVAPA